MNTLSTKINLNSVEQKNEQQKRKRSSWNRTFILYLILCGLRILLTCVPQSGYIHPDEYFQSIEVIAGNVFDVEYKQPWEFNHTQPIRSILIPYITVGIPYKILKIIDANLIEFFNISINIPYFLLTFPRIFVCLSSFLVDYCLYKICRINNEQYLQKLLFLASSYVLFIYGTRTFSNTIEMVLLSVLLYLVADSQAFSRNVITQNEYLSAKYRKSKAAVDKARFYKLKLLLPSHSLRHGIAISIISVTGFFNRPTFVAFAVLPVFFWLHRGLGSKSVSFAEFHFRMILFLLYSMLTVFTYILVDSFYFGHLSIAELLQMDVSMENFVVTPLNFIRYNMDVKKLAEHGLHHRSLHVLINMPLLYNVLGLVTIGGMTTMLYRLLMGKYTRLPHIYSIQGLMTASIIAPIAALSYFPHQEPRFLIPVTLPVVLLFSNYVIHKTPLYKLWLLLNLICLLFYGFIHQAGIYPATVHLSKEIRLSQQQLRPVHVVTSNVYSLPVSLLQQQRVDRIYSAGATKYKVQRTFFLQEMGSHSLQLVVKQLTVMLEVANHSADDHKPKIFLLLPTSKHYELEIHTKQYNVSFDEIKTFYPHISTEALPDFHNILANFYINYSVTNLFCDFLSSCGLGLYEIQKL